MLVSAPDHPTVTPPPDAAPGPGRRGRWPSLFLAVVVLGLVAVLGFTSSARAAVPLLIPVAKGVTAAGASALAYEGFEAMFDTPADWGPDGPESDEAKKKRGKWADKLKGIPGVAAGILGSLFTLEDGFSFLFGDDDETDGLTMPPELAEDLDEIHDLGANFPGRRAVYSIDDVSWDVTGSSAQQVLASVSIGCVSTLAPTNCFPSTRSSIGTAYYYCFNPETGGYYVDSKTVFTTGLFGAPCLRGETHNEGNDSQNPVASVILRTPGESPLRGLDRASIWHNPEFSPDGDRPDDVSITAEVACHDSAGVIHTVSKTAAGNSVVPVATCPPDMVPESIGWTANNGATGESEWLGGVKPTTPEAYPDCPPGQCTRVITIDGEPCSAHRPECYDWMNTQPPERLKCEYGPHNMPLAECADLEHIHKSTWGVTPSTDPETQPKWMPVGPDGNPDPTRTGTIWEPEENPNPEYRPPVRGPIVTPRDNPDPSPTPTPTPVPPGGGFPDSGVNPPAVGNPTDPDTGQSCIAGAWSWNPVDWVFVPVKCAFQWAFVPKNAGQVVTSVQDSVMDAGLGDWLQIVPAFIEAIPDSDGMCMGPALNMPEMLGGGTYYPLNACEAPMDRYAQMSRAVMTVVVSFAGVISIVNSVSTAFTGYKAFEREGLAIDAAKAKEEKTSKA